MRVGKAAAVIQSADSGDRLNKHQRFFGGFRQTLVELIQTLLIEINIGPGALLFAQHFTQQRNARQGVLYRM